jgi:putative FmdB family regulatory protein
MPIYEYLCEDCGASYEVFQKMSDDPLVECEKCGGPLRKVLHPVAIHFKGSGFYTTDYGKGSGRRSGAREAGSDDVDSSGDGGSSSKKDTGAGTASAAADKGSSGDGKAKETQKAT